MSNEVNECLANHINKDNVRYHNNVSRNLFDRSARQSNTFINNTVNVCSENKISNKIPLRRCFDEVLFDT